jgi:phosphoribosylamine--glycine ligase
MKILMISDTGDGLGIAQHLVSQDNEVAVWIKNHDYDQSGLGIVLRPKTWREKLAWADFVICDMVGFGHLEDVFRRMGKPYIACNPFLDQMELERDKGMQIFQKLGITTPETFAFGSTSEAKTAILGMDFGLGFVLKPDGNIGTAKTLVIKDKEELAWAFGTNKENTSMIVQRIVEGVEVSTEGWFNGRDFLSPFNHTFEEKRFMEGNLGPNTGCMGNVVLARESNKLTKATVERLKPFLSKVGYRGPVDVNCIVNEQGAFALEATARFGYDAIEALVEGLKEPFLDLLFETSMGTKKTMNITEDAMIAVRLSVPPYPAEDVKQKDWGDPIVGINVDNISHLFLCNVFADHEDNTFKVAPADGLVLKATAHGGKKGGDYTSFARDRVYRTLDNIKCSNKQYRLDIGKRVNGDLAKLVSWGWMQP